MLVSSPSHVTFLSHTLGMLGRTRVIPFPQALPPRHKTPAPKAREAQNHTSWYLKQRDCKVTPTLVCHFWRFCHLSCWGREIWASVFTWPLASHLFQQLHSPYTWYCAWSNHHCSHLPVSVLDFMFSGPGRSVAVFPESLLSCPRKDLRI